MKTAVREAGPDALRLLCFVAIVLQHVNARGGFPASIATGFVLDELSRFAVPAFFLLSGYFWRSYSEPKLITLRVFGRVAPAFLFWLVLYNSMGFLGALDPKFEGRTPSPLWLITGGQGYHLWFLPGLVVGTAVAALSLRISLRAAFAITGALLLLGICLGAYSIPLFGIRTPSAIFRNGLLFAPFFLVAGVAVRRGWGSRVPSHVLALLVVVFAGAQVAEGLVTGRYPNGHDFGLATAVFAVCGSVLFLRGRGHIRIVTSLGQAAFGAYLIHVIYLEWALRLPLKEQPAILVVGVVLASLLTSWFANSVLKDTKLESLMR